jgi:glycosyltransferase involved in cell wall biosynthesis
MFYEVTTTATPTVASVARQSRDDEDDPLRDRSSVALDLVIPALNEEQRIGTTVAAICRLAQSLGWSMRLLIVDNGSVDATAEAIDRARSSDVPVSVIGCRTRGKGAAVRCGVLRSSAPYVAYVDADLSTPPVAIGHGVDLLALGWDVVIGSRRCAGASYSVVQPPLRRMGGVAFRALSRRVVPSISDTQCGFKAFRSDVAHKVFRETVVDGFAFDVEVLARARRHRARMIELPIDWSDQAGSTFRPRADGIESFRELASVRRALGRVPAGAV